MMQAPQYAIPPQAGVPTHKPLTTEPLPPVPAGVLSAASAQPQASGSPGLNTQVVASLGLFLRAQYDRSKQERVSSGIEEKMIRAKYARALEYEPAKKAQIAALFDASYEPPYMPVIETKCRALEDWVMDVYFQAGQRPFDVQNTPDPMVSQEVQDLVRMNYKEVIARQIVQEQVMPRADGGRGSLDPNTLDALIEEAMQAKAKMIEAEIKRTAKEMTEKFSITVEDRLAEGGWYQALRELVHDICTYPAAFMAGPEERMVTRRKRVFDPQLGRYVTKHSDAPGEKFRRVSPINVYPLVGGKTCRDGMIERTQYNPMDIQAMKGVQGFNDAEISAVLGEIESGALREWTAIDSRIANLDNKSSNSMYMGDNVDALIYWGQAPGKLLIEWGMNAKTQVITDPTRWYRVYAIQIGNHTIMARLNPNPDGRVNYFKASFIQDPDKFWNISLPDVLWPHQVTANAVIRACGFNVGIASGPIIEQDIDRIPDRGPLHALKRFFSTGSQMANGRAMNFYTVQLITGPLRDFYEFIMTLADYDSGVPRMAHGGQGPGGGVTNTASSMSMFLSTSARGVKAVIEHIDRGITEPSVEAEAYYILDNDESISQPPGELKIIAKGSSALIAKEQSAIRLKELLAETNNPVDMQIITADGRKHLLRDAMKALPIDLDKVLPEERQIIEQMTGAPMAAGLMEPQNGGGPGMPSAALSMAGDRMGGQDFSLFGGGA